MSFSHSSTHQKVVEWLPCARHRAGPFITSLSEARLGTSPGSTDPDQELLSLQWQPQGKGDGEWAQKAGWDTGAMCDLKTQVVICGPQTPMLRGEICVALCLASKGNPPAEAAQRPRKPTVHQKARRFAAALLSDTSLLSWGRGRPSLCRVSSLHPNTWSGAQLSALSPRLSPALSGPFGADRTAVSGKIQIKVRFCIPPLTVFFSPRIFKLQKTTNLQRFLRPLSSGHKTRPRICRVTLQDTVISPGFFSPICKVETITPVQGDFCHHGQGQRGVSKVWG